jgi:hypothetical protein
MAPVVDRDDRHRLADDEGIGGQRDRSTDRGHGRAELGIVVAGTQITRPGGSLSRRQVDPS